MLGCTNNSSSDISDKTEENDASESIIEDEELEVIESNLPENNEESIVVNSPEVVQFYNSAFLINANIFLRTNQIPMIENLDELLVMRSEIEGFEEELNILISNISLVEDIEEGVAILRELTALSYEAIEIYEKKLNGEDIKIYAVLEKITEAQNKYLSSGKLIDSKNIEITLDTISQIETIAKEIIEKY
jgi:hypothetical protein